MKTTSLYFMILYLILVNFKLWANEDDFSGLDKLMNDEQFRQTGLHKLTPAEINYLNSWLNNYLKGEKETATREIIQKETVTEEFPDRIFSQIDGEFNGWTGNTIFQLKNGQVWQQRHKRILKYSAINPDITIRKNRLGFYVMYINGTSYSVGVTRIK